MTTKRDKKDEPKAGKRPKLKKETLKDLAPKEGQAEDVGGGAAAGTGGSCFCSLKCGTVQRC